MLPPGPQRDATSSSTLLWFVSLGMVLLGKGVSWVSLPQGKHFPAASLGSGTHVLGGCILTTPGARGLSVPGVKHPSALLALASVHPGPGDPDDVG